MTKAEQDAFDFQSMLSEQDKLLGKFIAAKIADGKDPRDVAYLLRYYADCAHGWCTGRYG